MFHVSFSLSQPAGFLSEDFLPTTSTLIVVLLGCSYYPINISLEAMIRIASTLNSPSRRNIPTLRLVKSFVKTSLASKSASFVDDVETDSHSQFMLILGKPGGGKGTISKKILQDFPEFKHFSTGDLLRQHVMQKSDIGKEAKKHMDSGSLVPDDLIIRLVLDEAEKESQNGKNLLLDGFPRTLQQAEALAESVDVDIVVNLDIPNDTIVERIANRYIHPASGRVYNLTYNPPKVPGKDDETGEDLIQRDDDKPDTVRKRLEAYEKVTAPLVKYYDGKVHTFSGTESDVIYPKINIWLQDQLQSNL